MGNFIHILGYVWYMYTPLKCVAALFSLIFLLLLCGALVSVFAFTIVAKRAVFHDCGLSGIPVVFLFFFF